MGDPGTVMLVAAVAGGGMAAGSAMNKGGGSKVPSPKVVPHKVEADLDSARAKQEVDLRKRAATLATSRPFLTETIKTKAGSLGA